MHSANSNSIAELSGFAASRASTAISARLRDAVQADFGGPENGDVPDSFEAFPAWLAGGIIVALSSVFWVGLLTILGWIV